MTPARAFSIGLRAYFRSLALPCIQNHSFTSHVQVLTSNSPPAFSTSLSASLGLAASAIQAQEEVDFYNVKVITSRRRGAGTLDPVFLQLIGLYGSTDKLLLETDDDDGFGRGSHKRFTVPVPRGIGPLRRAHVEKMASPELERGGGWYLRQIEVENHVGETVIFPCNSWIGDSDCGVYKGAHGRNLLPAAADVMAGHHAPVHVIAAGMSIPHPEKVQSGKVKGINQQGFGYGGEDAYFFCEGRHHLFGMGVADGVYGWRDVGIDSGLMSQTLMRNSMHMIQRGVEDVFNVLESGTRHVLSEGLKGSCTASVVVINQDNGQVHAANLGDSGFMVLGRSPDREYLVGSELEVKFRSSQLEHEFGRPFQIGHHEHASRPEDADLVSFYVCPGDVVVMGSDGLLDNLTDGEITSALAELIVQGAAPSRMVQRLLKLAFDASVDKTRSTPYSRDASEAFNMVYSGGKPDDITVLVALCK